MQIEWCIIMKRTVSFKRIVWVVFYPNFKMKIFKSLITKSLLVNDSHWISSVISFTLFIMVISHIYWQISTCTTKAIQRRYISIISSSIENANLCINSSTQKITNCSVLQKINFYKRYFMKIAFKRIYTALVVTYYKLIFGNDYLLFISIF